MKTACICLYLHRTKNTGKVSLRTCFFFVSEKTSCWTRHLGEGMESDILFLCGSECLVTFNIANETSMLFSSYSGIEGDLVACVAMCSAVREKLCPALLHTYCAVDIVEGLDVDKEEFDKFSARYEHSVVKSHYKKENANSCFC